MDRTSTRRPRRLRALLVAGALTASMFATALPAAAAPPEHARPNAEITTQGLTWVRGGEISPQGLTWVRSVDASVDGLTWVR